MYHYIDFYAQHLPRAHLEEAVKSMKDQLEEEGRTAPSLGECRQDHRPSEVFD